jgi:hypothetical protein
VQRSKLSNCGEHRFDGDTLAANSHKLALLRAKTRNVIPFHWNGQVFHVHSQMMMCIINVIPSPDLAMLAITYDVIMAVLNSLRGSHLGSMGFQFLLSPPGT